LPMTISLSSEIHLAHSSPFRPERWDYLISPDDIHTAVRFFSERLCFVGHSHRPFIVKITPDRGYEFISATSCILEDGSRYLINVGSVGQPRDGDPRGGYVIYDIQIRRLEHYRFEYDIAATQVRIRMAGLPGILAERLALGC